MRGMALFGGIAYNGSIMTKILLVEDDKSLREIYGIRLAAEGYDIVSAGDGEEALAMAAQVKPDLIISDVMMPKISGFDMVDILRQTPGTQDIKVIMMTALSSEDQRVKGESIGADRYLVKSQVGIEDVVNVVHEVLGDKAPGQSVPAGGMVMSALAQNAAGMTPADVAGLPQPVAPFTSPRPANLGEKMLNPISDMSGAPVDHRAEMEQRVAQELSDPVGGATVPNVPVQGVAVPAQAGTPGATPVAAPVAQSPMAGGVVAPNVPVQGAVAPVQTPVAPAPVANPGVAAAPAPSVPVPPQMPVAPAPMAPVVPVAPSPAPAPPPVAPNPAQTMPPAAPAAPAAEQPQHLPDFFGNQ